MKYSGARLLIYFTLLGALVAPSVEASLDSARFPDQPASESAPSAIRGVDRGDDGPGQPRKNHKVLFVDLNDSDKEVDACNRGIRAGNPSDCVSDGEDLGADRPPACMAVVHTSPAHPNVTASMVRAKVAEMARQGDAIDTIVISGHDGTGHFFGKGNSEIYASDLTKIMADYPEVAKNLTSAVLWGCYPTNVYGCENHWLKQTGPHVKIAAGFTLQSPDNTKEGNFTLLEDYCKKREVPVKAQSDQELEDFFHNLKNVHNWQFGICTEKGVCSAEYKEKDDKSPNPKCFHTYEELHRRCAEFDPDRKVTEEFSHFLEPDDEAHADPPPDSEPVFASGVQVGKKKSELRRYYDQVHLWRHCAEMFKRNKVPFLMPNPAQVIRLVKFATWKDNLAALHAKEIDQYNDLLKRVGATDLTIDPDNQTRKQMVDATKGAVSRLEAHKGEVIDGIEISKLWTMARGFDRTIRELDHSCSHFNWVHEDSRRHSPCIKAYGVENKWAN